MYEIKIIWMYWYKFLNLVIVYLKHIQFISTVIRNPTSFINEHHIKVISLFVETGWTFYIAVQIHKP